MKNYILTSMMAMLVAQSAYALDVVYPKKNEVELASPTTFFVGNSDVDKVLKINGEVVPVHKSGGFAHFVNLESGLNEFVLESGDDVQIFKITNNQNLFENGTVYTKAFSEPRAFVTTKDNVPLRSTPIDGGINRIAHYSKDMPLKVIGQTGAFYQVELNSEKTAWINISHVEEGGDISVAKLINKESSNDDEYYVFKFEFDKKVPYVIEGGYPFVVKFYNVKGEENETLTFTFPLVQKLAGYSGKFEDNTFVLKIRKFPVIKEEKPLKNIKIVVDAGHGGKEIGSIGCLRNEEKDINLSIAKYLEKELKSRGADVIMTRRHDDYVDLYDRVELANEKDAMIFLSIHTNALPDTMNPLENTGTSIYYYYPQAKALADAIMKNMNEQLPFSNDKVRKGSLAVVRNTNALSVLIEVAYLINPEDNAKLLDKDIQKDSAKAIADGLEEFMKN